MAKSTGSTADAGGTSVTACPACHERPPEPFLTLRSMPILCNELYGSEASARSSPCGDISLVVCPKCALIYNRSFEPHRIEYSPHYQNPLHVSASFRAFADALSRRLVSENGLAGGTAVEIGCGDGFFLELMLKHGMRSGTGYDPSAKGRAADQPKDPRLRIVTELFEKAPLGEQIDAVICRHVFEHLPDPGDFLLRLRDMIGICAPLVYFEVPNAEWMLTALSVWDVIYEHFTYWAPAPLAALFVRAGFTPCSLSAGFGGQFLMLEARPSPVPAGGDWPPPREVLRITELCRRFGEACTELATRWRSTLLAQQECNMTTVLWGAGSKGVTFANLIAGGELLVAGIVDINPSKQGKYVGGCGLPVLAPEDLKVMRPDTVLLMNENYKAETAARLEELGLKATIRCVGSLP